MLRLLSEVAREQPLICVIDDGQWLDRASAQTFGFVARRLAAEPVGLVFAARIPGQELAGLPELTIDGLRESEARALLDWALPGPFDARVRDLIVAETHGNPRALLELLRGPTPAELAGGFGLPGALPWSGRIEESLPRQLAALPPPAKRILQLAAADPTGDRSLRERQLAHEVLAEVTDPRADCDRRAWHRAMAAPGPDEDAAAELENSAARAQDRGGLAAVAAFLERAAWLSADPARDAERVLAAARAHLRAGAFGKASELLAAARTHPLDELSRAQADLLRGQFAFAADRGREAPSLLLKAAGRLEPLDLELAREAYLSAWMAALFAGRLAGGGDLLEVSLAARALPQARPPRPVDLVLDGLTLLVTAGPAAAAPALRQAASVFAGAGITPAEGLSWGGPAKKDPGSLASCGRCPS